MLAGTLNNSSNPIIMFQFFANQSGTLPNFCVLHHMRILQQTAMFPRPAAWLAANQGCASPGPTYYALSGRIMRGLHRRRRPPRVRPRFNRCANSGRARAAVQRAERVIPLLQYLHKQSSMRRAPVGFWNLYTHRSEHFGSYLPADVAGWCQG